MKLLAVVSLLLAFLCGAAVAQTAVETARAMPQAERSAIQSDLAWVGVYNGAIDGEVGARMINAIKAWQKQLRARQSGLLKAEERTKLAAKAKKLQAEVGWKVAADPVNGIRLGIPTRLVPHMSSTGSGSKWSSAQGQILIGTWRLKAVTLAAVAEREKNEPAGRKVAYSVVRPDFFVLSGLQGGKKFYVRGEISGQEVRGMTILYDQASESTMAPVIIAMSSAFTPFPAGAAQADLPPPRRTVEYATGIVVSTDGAIITDRQAVEGCQFITIPGHGHADRVAEDKTRGLALLRIYGARDLKPIAIGGGRPKPNLVLTGIADPQSQTGGAAVTTAQASLSGAAALAPAPAIGFAGAAAVDSEGTFAGVALLEPAVVASAAATTGRHEATLVPADEVRAFLTANSVTANMDATADAQASVLRVICVRK